VKEPEPGTLYVVATPIGNLEDLSPRARRILAEVDRIAAEDTRRSLALLRHFGIRTPLVSLHEHNEQARVEQVCTWLGAGEAVALVSDAGTPLISDPGYLMVRELRRRGFPVRPIPGPSALIAALSVAGLPTDRFAFEGFLPARSAARRARLEALAAEPRTLVFYESPRRAAASLADMAGIFGGTREAVVARELTKVHEEIRGGTLDQLAAWAGALHEGVRGELVFVVAGAPERGEELPEAATRLVARLLEEMPLKQAVRVAAEVTGASRNRLYDWALKKTGR